MVNAFTRLVVTWSLDFLYLFIYLITFGTKTIHEGTFFRKLNTYVNWNIDYHVQPTEFVAPTTEAAIQEAVRKASRVRAVGGGHSFNSGTLCDATILSLDNYNKVLEINHTAKTVKVQAGIRLRDFMTHIEANNLSLPTLGSTNAQSLGGLVATDLHGTRNTEGYLSNQIKSLKLVDANGDIHTFHQGSDELAAVAGGIGALGVVIEIELQCVPMYRLEKKVIVVEQTVVSDSIEKLLGYNHHLSFYYIGGTKIQTCRMNTWNETVHEVSFLYKWRHFLTEIFDFILCSAVLVIGRFTKKLDYFGPIGMMIMKIFMNRSITGFASQSFSRQLFYRHDEIEYGIPREKFNAVMEELLVLLRTKCDYVTIVEVRFGGASPSLLGPGSNRETVFIELAPSLTADPVPMFKEAEILFKRFGGKPHLGKWTTATPDYMREVHGENFNKFLKLRKQYDPKGKFTNQFVTQVFGSA
jgi:hypothetical protein